MKKLFYILGPLVLVGFLIITAALPQNELTKPEVKIENPKLKDQKNKTPDYPSEHVKSALNCKSCHASEYPTKMDPGLIDCPRKNLVSVYHSPKEGPESVVINEMSDKYSGVVFSHRVHAEMSEMSTGCTGCHHYNTTGPVLNCRNCHENTRAREDVSVPDLKAAYHRQCMTCHKEWSRENGCNILCHISKGSELKQNIDPLRGKSHPELPVPTKITWETNSDINKTVTFYHDEHVKLFNINCTSCHRKEGCIKCHGMKSHDNDNKPVKIEKSLEEHHMPCISCHYGNSCLKCHHEKEMAPFDHGKSSGWNLSAYHNNVACANCHGSIMPYRKVSSKCASCHKDFTAEFDHKLIGFTFSESHKELECENCHSGKDFIKSPVCTNCHDDKSFPNDLPGKKSRK